MKPSSGLVAQRDDETIYSMMARLGRYLAVPDAGRLHRGVFRVDRPTIDGLPSGLGKVVASGVFGIVEVDHAIREWTLYPYFANYAAIPRSDAMAKLMEGEGAWPPSRLGLPDSHVSPGALRFCRRCVDEMVELHSDPWWRRSHQLPSVLVCPDHEIALQLSTVTREMRRGAYVAASPENCHSDAALAIARSPAVLSDLLALARSSDRLLDSIEIHHPDDRREKYLEELSSIGMLNVRAEANLVLIARAMDAYWGETLAVWPELTEGGLCSQGWLGTLLLGEHRSPPLHHMLLEGLLAAKHR